VFHRKERKVRKDIVTLTLRALRCSISLIIYFNSHARRRLRPTTPVAAACTYLSQPMLSACADKKQAGIIFISLLTTDKHR